MHDFTLVDSQRKTKTKNIASKLKKKKKTTKNNLPAFHARRLHIARFTLLINNSVFFILTHLMALASLRLLKIVRIYVFSGFINMILRHY